MLKMKIEVPAPDLAYVFTNAGCDMTTPERDRLRGAIEQGGLGSGLVTIQVEDLKSLLGWASNGQWEDHAEVLDAALKRWERQQKQGGQVTERTPINAEQATKEKGYPHPGSFIVLPDNGGVIHFQYGHPQEVGRNGCFMHDVVQALIDNLSVYQQAGHPLACKETTRTIDALKIAKGCILDRRADRQGRGVHQTDKP